MKNNIFKKLISHSILLVIVITLNIGFYLVIKSKLSDVQNRIRESRVTSEENAALNKLASSIDAVKSDIERLNSRLVAKDGEVLFLENIERLARSQGNTITVNDAKYEEIEGQKQIQYLRIALVVDGSWSSTYSFIKLLESMPYKIEIDSVFLNYDTQAKSSGVWNTAISLRTIKEK